MSITGIPPIANIHGAGRNDSASANRNRPLWESVDTEATSPAQSSEDDVSVQLTQVSQADREAEESPLKKLFADLLRRWNMKIDY